MSVDKVVERLHFVSRPVPFLAIIAIFITVTTAPQTCGAYTQAFHAPCRHAVSGQRVHGSRLHSCWMGKWLGFFAPCAAKSKSHIQLVRGQASFCSRVFP